MNKFHFVVALLCAFTIIGSSSLQAQEVDHGNYAEKARDVVNLVEKATASFDERGKEYTLKLLNASSGPFKLKELYVFSADMKGIVIAQSANRALKGKSLWNVKDTKGKLFVREMIEVAQGPGSGWVEYWWLRSGEGKPTLKRSYIRKVPGHDIFVGSGYYVN